MAYDHDGAGFDVEQFIPGLDQVVEDARKRFGTGEVHDDKATPGQTTLAKLPYLRDQFFQGGIDVFMPAAEPANGTITKPTCRAAPRSGRRRSISPTRRRPGT